LNELNEDYRRSDFITFSLQSSKILKALVHLLTHSSDEIRLLVVRLLVMFLKEPNLYDPTRKR